MSRLWMIHVFTAVVLVTATAGAQTPTGTVTPCVPIPGSAGGQTMPGLGPRSSSTPAPQPPPAPSAQSVPGQAATAAGSCPPGFMPAPVPSSQPATIGQQPSDIPTPGESSQQGTTPGADRQRQQTSQDAQPRTPPERMETTSTTEPLSLLELAFQSLVSPMGESARPLRQFGYGFFRSPTSTFAPVDDVPVGPDYIVGPGDDLIIYIWGPDDSTLMRTVDRNGQIVLPKVGPVSAWGLTFSQTDRLIREQLARNFVGYGTSVTLGRLRSIRVNVVGEVRQPGTYTVGGLARLTNALVASGGPALTGSLRQIRLHRNAEIVGTFDFYDYLLRGDKQNDFRLESGDTIFVPAIGPVAAIVGEVQRPAIYELKGAMRLNDLIETAAGVSPRAYLKRVQILRAQPSAERMAIDVDMTRYYVDGDSSADLVVAKGDLVRIFTSDTRVYNTINVEGAVKYPGDYEWRSGMRLAQVITSDSVLPEAFLDRVEIARRNPDRSIQLISVNLRQAWTGDLSQNIVLTALDRVTVKIDRRDQIAPRSMMVTLNGEFRRPGPYAIAAGETLSSVIARAGGFTDRAYLKGGVFTRQSIKGVEEEQLRAFVRLQQERMLSEASTTVLGADKDEQADRTRALAARRELLTALSSRVTVGRVVVRLDEPGRLEGTSDDLLLEDGDTLTVGRMPGSVLVIGAVRTFASVSYKPGEGIDHYVNRVGGLTAQADKRATHIVKGDGSAVSGFSAIRTVDPGDTIVVPPKEEEKVRWLPTIRDIAQIFGSTLISVAALALLF
jgi:polysaccharide biosynthesis/export protein